MTPGATPPADDSFVAVCPMCGKRIVVDRSDEGKNLTCPYCNQTINLSQASQYDQLHYPDGHPQPNPNPQENPGMGWLLFILIFGVGNVILYMTTGIFLIPIRR